MFCLFFQQFSLHCIPYSLLFGFLFTLLVLFIAGFLPMLNIRLYIFYKIEINNKKRRKHVREEYLACNLNRKSVRESKFSLLTRVVFKTLFLAQRVFFNYFSESNQMYCNGIETFVVIYFFFSETTESERENELLFVFLVFPYW